MDFGILAAYLKNKGAIGYNTIADFNRNDIVNIIDFGLLSVNYLKISSNEVTVRKIEARFRMKNHTIGEIGLKIT